VWNYFDIINIVCFYAVFYFRATALVTTSGAEEIMQVSGVPVPHLSSLSAF